MIGSRALFPSLKDRAYLAHAGVSPPSLPVRNAVATLLEKLAERGADAVGEVLAMRPRLRSKLARLLGCGADQLALTPGTSWGVLAVAQNFPWKPGDRLALVRGEFPTNVTPWQRAARQYGLELVWLDPDLEGLEHELQRGLRLLAMSAVQFQTGRRMPWADTGRRCHTRDCQVFVDAIQALGVVPFEVGELDYVAGGSHKWLMGVEGCGYLYVRPDRQAALERRWAAWLSHQEPVGFLFEGPGHLRYDRPLREDIGFLELGSSSATAQAALEASLDLLLELGVERIFAHVSGYLDALEPRLQALGWESLRRPEWASGTLALRGPRPVAEVAAALGSQGVRVSTPDGLIRVAPHWPNSLAEIDLVERAFRAIDLGI